MPKEPAWFHVYNRGVARENVFRSGADRRAFLDCFARLLSPEPACDRRGRWYPHMKAEIAVGAYCLMPNHFHLIVHASGGDALFKLMKSTMTAYGRYFNRRHNRCGPVWQGPYQAKPLPSATSLLRATAYVTLNHDDDLDYRWSSHRHLVGELAPVWLNHAALIDAIGDRATYERYVNAELAARTLRRLREEAKPHTR